MTDFSSLVAADRGQSARTIQLVDRAGFEAWVKSRPGEDRALLEAHRFEPKGQALAILPRPGGEFEVVAAVDKTGALDSWALAKLAEVLPEGNYRVAGRAAGKAILGWLLAQHRFDAYRSKSEEAERGPRVLVTGEAALVEPMVRLAEAVALVRDLVNTPAIDLGPAELETAVRDRLAGTGAEIRVTGGDELAAGYPLIAAVGGAATRARAPRLIEAEWGNASHPRLAIVGKGVCFDSGGLDIKGASGMRLMKKDMGGGAHALALAHLIITAKLPVRLHLLIPAVENAVSGGSYRPGDIIRSRKGLQVEIDNTDAEGRLILADSLAKAVEGEPELIVDFATLTGAARVALGPDLPALFSNADELAAKMLAAGSDVDDPVWRMPLWPPYDEMLKSDVADLANAAGSPMAGAVVAAMFLKRFVPDSIPWAHFDTFAWRDKAQPGRPKGGDALALRAVFATLESLFPGQ